MRAIAFAELGVAWLEEPLICEDIPGHARLVAKARLPIAAGENLSNRFEFQTYIDSAAIDILQPDVCRIGGITETAAVVGMGAGNGTRRRPTSHDGALAASHLRSDDRGADRIYALVERDLW